MSIKKSRQHKTLHEVFVSSKGAIDLASIMVGIVIIGIVGGLIAATVFAVIPWTQDNAAKHQLEAAHTAESVFTGMSMTGDTPVGSIVNASAKADAAPTGTSYGNKQELDAGGYLKAVESLTKLCVTTQDEGANYSAAIRSDTGNFFVSTNLKPTPEKVEASSVAANSIIQGCIAAGQPMGIAVPPVVLPPVSGACVPSSESGATAWSITDSTLRSRIAGSLGKDASSLTLADAASFNDSTLQLNGVTSAEGLEKAGKLTVLDEVYGDSLTTLAGLDCIQQVTGSVWFLGNSSLTDINGLNALVSVGTVYIANNPALTAVSGFKSLTTTTDSVGFSQNPALESITGFTALTTIGGTFTIDENPALTAVSGFNKLLAVTSAFSIVSNPVLANLTSFTSLKTVGYTFYIYLNEGLQSIDFPAIERIEEAVTLSQNATLKSITGFSRMETTSTVSISENFELLSINGFNSLSSPYSVSAISNNSQLVITGFDEFATSRASVSMSAKKFTGFQKFTGSVGSFKVNGVRPTSLAAFKAAAAYK